MRFFLVFITLFIVKCSTTYQKNPPTKIPEINAFENYAASLDSLSIQSYDSALNLVQKAIRLNPNFAKFYQLEGDIYHQSGKPERAINSYIEATKRRSNSVKIYIKIASIYEEDFSDFASAILYYRRALAVDNSRLELLLKISDCYIKNNQIELARSKVDEYQKLMNAANHSLTFEYYFLSGKIYFTQNDYENSMSVLKNAIQLKPRHFQSKLLFAKSLFKLNQFDDGLRYINELLNYDDKVGELYFYRGLYYFNKEKFQDAITLFNLALKFDSSILEAHYYLGRIYEDMNNIEEALQHYQKFRESMNNEAPIIDIKPGIKITPDKS